jgi:hypothetical protein
MRGGVVVRAAGKAADPAAPSNNANGMPTLYGHFTPFNRWTEIDSWFEGNFMERIAPGAFKKSFRETTPKVLFQHGGDPQVGDKPLGPPDVLREEEEGPYYEVPLLDTSYNRDLVPGLEAGLYGASFRFSVMREEFVEEPGVSDGNPKGLPERTIKEARVPEFGPVSFPAYPDATADVRSMTDEMLVARAASNPDSLRAILAYLEQREAHSPSNGGNESAEGATVPVDEQDDEPAAVGSSQQDTAPPKDRAEDEPHPVEGRRDTSPTRLYGEELLYGVDLNEEHNPWKL